MPPRNKKSSAGPYDKRHENGLIPPGKKVSKPRHNVHANGDVSAYSTSSQIHGVKGNTPSPAVLVEDDEADHVAVAGGEEQPRAGEQAWWTSRSDAVHDNSPYGTEEYGGLNGELEDMPKKRHAANGGASSKHSSSRDVMSADNVLTIIGPHSHWDVIAILLLLLHLPPLFLVTIQFAFAFMTFGNTSNPWSITSFHSVPDWFRSHGGNPSVVVSLILDVGFTIIWLFLPILKTFVLDLAPVVVALSLGGGAAATDSWRHAALSIATVFLRHVFQEKHRRQYLLNVSWACISKLSFDPLTVARPVQFLPDSHQASRTWGRVLLELHIVIQGFVRVIRRWMQSSSMATVRLDPDTSSSSAGSTAQVYNDTGSEGSRQSNSEGRVVGPHHNHNKPMSSSKQRRLQATIVRTIQPFWAAIASTKIQVTKEIDNSQAERDAYEAEAKDVEHLGDSRSSSFEDRVWITKLRETEIWFTMLLIRKRTAKLEPDAASDIALRRDLPDLEGIDVRVNGAVWSSAMMEVNTEETEWTKQNKRQIDGRIPELTPDTEYRIEFLRTADKKVIYSANVATKKVSSAEHVPVLATQPKEAKGPSSPVTTLKMSITTADSQLNEAKSQASKARKGRQATIKKLEEEVNGMNRSLTSGGPNERQMNRQRQYRQNIKQAEESSKALDQEINDLGDIPEAVREAFDTSKSRWEEASREKDSLQKELDTAKRDSQRKIREAREDTVKTHGKREKAEARLATLNEKQKAATDGIEAKRNQRTLSETQHAYKLENFQAQEAHLTQQLQSYSAQRRDLEAKIVQIDQQQNLYLDTNFPQPMNMAGGLPLTPESMFANPATTPRGPAQMGWQASAGAPPPGAMVHRQNSERQRTRGRSSSMLSNVSGFTEDALPMDAASAGYDIPRAHSGSSGSQRKQTSPTSKTSPVAAEVGRDSPKSLKQAPSA